MFPVSRVAYLASGTCDGACAFTLSAWFGLRHKHLVVWALMSILLNTITTAISASSHDQSHYLCFTFLAPSKEPSKCMNTPLAFVCRTPDVPLQRTAQHC